MLLSDVLLTPMVSIPYIIDFHLHFENIINNDIQSSNFTDIIDIYEKEAISLWRVVVVKNDTTNWKVLLI